MKKILAVTTIALTAIRVAVRAIVEDKSNVELSKDGVKIKAPVIKLNGNLHLR